MICCHFLLKAKTSAIDQPPEVRLESPRCRVVGPTKTNQLMFLPAMVGENRVTHCNHDSKDKNLRRFM